ncbi:MAG: MOSC domain-containing protein [Myxococcales bacterium]|nr:MOSC domain-containing protein [Myxococcales bacterium]MCB9627922.1 MOSC domain-containing protein [Sandaracinaceae bacterium]
MDANATLRELLEDVPQVGRLEWIGLRPARREGVVVVQSATLVAGRGLEGDRYARKGGKRQVSLIQHEHLPVIDAFTERSVTPELLRRNLVVAGIPLAALRRLRFRIGEVELLGTDRCAPCSRMREALGPGGYAAMLDMGGILASVTRGGVIRVGDEVRALGFPEP